MRSEHGCLRGYNDRTDEVVTKRTPRGFTVSRPIPYPRTHTHPEIRPIRIVGEHHQLGIRAVTVFMISPPMRQIDTTQLFASSHLAYILIALAERSVVPGNAWTRFVPSNEVLSRDRVFG